MLTAPSDEHTVLHYTIVAHRTMFSMYRSMLQWSSRRTIMTVVSPVRKMAPVPQIQYGAIGAFTPAAAPKPSMLSMLLGLTQKRWKSRGNTYQPSTLKRKRRVGFLARARSRTGRNILKRRREKGRWYLTH
ncbi:AGR081Cp [Eremothecium gossypii ATCC 10895]|uniref:Large ribosomal subunit protein bL34m n=1 Tax=Eremothecium gossypii (strain ATCC 10895 / CBS 109.51 / FGSC 9923 / NRRL Y-1056) TaxID=284811 RepID=Q74ZX7_EREGS|nr:putative mitochondrial 54S ribosomal protein [Eremothecium gossypii ATCC 10895]AAS54570.1 AGR081Cp [Eremothecium gossypii ATCC 10895]AEY98902.1 FAGR081Cp [Eremothecium gossypii FDAG1]